MELILENCPFRNVIAYSGSPVQTETWHAALLFAAGDQDLIAQFEQDTALVWPIKSISQDGPPPLSQSERDHVLLEFVHWFNAHIWREDPFSGA